MLIIYDNWKRCWRKHAKIVFKAACPNQFGVPRWLSKELAWQSKRCRRWRFNPWVAKVPEGGTGNPLQYSCLEKPIDRGAQCVTIHRAVKSRTRLSNWAHQSVSLTWLYFFFFLSFFLTQSTYLFSKRTPFTYLSTCFSPSLLLEHKCQERKDCFVLPPPNSQHWHSPWINTGPVSLYLHSYTLDINIICADATYVPSVAVSPECHTYTSNCCCCCC